MTPVESLALQRATFMAVSRAVVDAVRDAAGIRDEPCSAGRARRYRDAVHRLVALQTQALAAHDMVIELAGALGAHPGALAELCDGRAAMLVQLRQTAEHARRADRPGPTVG